MPLLITGRNEMSFWNTTEHVQKNMDKSPAISVKNRFIMDLW